MTVIKTERLILRPFEARDAAPLFAVFGDACAMRYWSSLPHKDVGETARFVDAVIGADPASTVEFVIERNGAVIGKAGFWAMPEVGFLIHPDHWGQGIGSEAIRAMIRFGFETLKLAQITADVDPRNAGSLALLRKLGFYETGRAANTIELGDEWCDSIYLALDAPDSLDAPGA